MQIHIVVNVNEFPDEDEPDYDSIMTEIIADAVRNGDFEYVG